MTVKGQLQTRDQFPSGERGLHADPAVVQIRLMHVARAAHRLQRPAAMKKSPVRTMSVHGRKRRRLAADNSIFMKTTSDWRLPGSVSTANRQRSQTRPSDCRQPRHTNPTPNRRVIPMPPSPADRSKNQFLFGENTGLPSAAYDHFSPLEGVADTAVLLILFLFSSFLLFFQKRKNQRNCPAGKYPRRRPARGHARPPRVGYTDGLDSRVITRP